MNRLVLSIITCLYALTNPVWAEDKLSISDFEITPGVIDKEFSINLDNDVAYAAFQFDLYLPNGLTVTDYTPNPSRLPENTTLDMKQQPDGCYRFIAVANDLTDISGSNGCIITIKVSANNNTEFGNLNGSFKNIKLSKKNGFGNSYDEMIFPIKIVEPSIIRVRNYTREYGEPNPKFEYNVEGGEIFGEPVIKCNATETSAVGSYPITIEKGSIKNDIVTFINDSTLTVTKAPLNIAAGTYTKKQGDSNPEFTLTYTGFKNNDTKDVLTKQPTVVCEATDASEPGEYPITLSGAEAINYDISYTNGKLIVVDATPVIITAVSYTRLYGEANPHFEFTSEGATLDGIPEIVCEATTTSPVGTYDIIVTQGTVKNYNVTYQKGTLTITKTPLNIAVGTYTKKQGDPMPEFALTYSGFKNNDNKDCLIKQPIVSCDASIGSEPGEYPITISGAEATNYDISYTAGNLIVTEADAVIVKAQSYTRLYGEENPTFDFTVEGESLNGIPEIICDATPTSPVGTYDIIIKKGSISNYNVTYISGTLTITKAPLNIAIGNYTKKQGEPMPEFTLTYSGFKNNETKEVLSKQPNVTCNATEASEPGIYPIIVSGAEATNYDISYTNGQLTITDADKVTIIAQSYTREYGDNNPEFEYTTEGATLDGKPEIVCEATATSPVGTYDIIVKQGSVKNYNVSFVAGTLTITKAPLNIAADTYIKKQGEKMPDFTLSYTGFKNNETKDVLTKQPITTCDATESSEPGEYPVIVSGAEARNYDISYTEGKLIVTEADLIIITAKNYTRKYGEANPDFGFTTEGGTLNGKPEITCEANEISPVGTYDIIVKQGTVTNYNVQYVTGTLTIEQAPLTISVGTYAKKQGDSMPEFSLTYKGFKNNDTENVLTKQPTLTCNANESSEPGEYPITISGAEALNYYMIYEHGKLIIVDADPVVVIAKNYNRNYGDENPVFEYTVEGENLDGTPEIVCEATATSPVGTYDIIVKAGSVKNYNVTYVAGTLTINKAPLNIKAGTYTKKQGEAMPDFTLTYEGLKNNENKDVLTKPAVVTCNANEASNPGEYPVRVSGAEARNYDISYTNGKLIVTQAAPVTITANSYTRKYGENNPIFEFTSEGAVLDGIPEIICEATETSPVGTYDIIIKKGTLKNYNVNFIKGTLTIEKTPLNVAAGIYTKKQGDPMPEFTLTYTGFKNDETKDILTKQAVIECEADETSVPGEYSVTVSGAEARNYDISYTNGVLIVTESDAVIVKAKNYSRQYGEANPSFDYTVEGASLEGTPEIVCEATTLSPVGSYDIIIKQGSVSNYNVTYVKGTLTITKTPLNIAAGTYTKKQGDPMPEFTLSYTGFKNNENQEVLTKQAIVTCYANEASQPGEYPVKVSGAEAVNYDINYTNGQLIVTEADAIIVKANSYTRQYGDVNPTFEYTVEGENLNGTPEIVCEATATSPVGTYDIVIKKGSVSNYNVVYVAGSLTIEKAPLNISAGTYTKKQGEEMPSLSLTYSGFKNNETKDVLTKLPDVACEANETSAPGEYEVIVSGAEGRNYDISYTKGKLIVTEADAVIITAMSYTRRYGEENPVFEYETEGVALDGTPEIACEATTTSPVGTYDIIIKQGSVRNYNIVYVTGTLTIEKAPLTIAAGTYVKKQGAPMPEFTLTYTGFKNNENQNALTKLPSVECEANEASAPGEYLVRVSGAESINYDISYTNGKLIVVKANAIIIKVKDATRLYGDENPAFEFTTEGEALVGTPEIQCDATTTSPVGTYSIIIKQGSVQNYNVTYVTGTLTIEKAPLIVTTDDYTREKGQENPEFELHYYGWKNGENESVLLSKPEATTSATKESAAGEYVISISGGEAQNYWFDYSNGILTVIQSNDMTNITSDERTLRIYTIAGKRMNASSIKALPRGIYIINGRKVAIK